MRPLAMLPLAMHPTWCTRRGAVHSTPPTHTSRHTARAHRPPKPPAHASRHTARPHRPPYRPPTPPVQVMKVAGMLLETGIADITEMLSSEEALGEITKGAIEVLHGVGPGGEPRAEDAQDMSIRIPTKSKTTTRPWTRRRRPRLS